MEPDSYPHPCRNLFTDRFFKTSLNRLRLKNRTIAFLSIPYSRYGYNWRFSLCIPFNYCRRQKHNCNRITDHLHKHAAQPSTRPRLYRVRILPKNLIFLG
jgi:hypothetical protein